VREKGEKEREREREKEREKKRKREREREISLFPRTSIQMCAQTHLLLPFLGSLHR
jgi:hypothetical protein